MSSHEVIEAALWNVEFSTDPKEGQTWRRNHIVGVVSKELGRAIDIVLEVHPDARFHAVHRRTHAQQVLVDKDLLEAKE